MMHWAFFFLISAFFYSSQWSSTNTPVKQGHSQESIVAKIKTKYCRCLKPANTPSEWTHLLLGESTLQTACLGKEQSGRWQRRQKKSLHYAWWLKGVSFVPRVAGDGAIKQREIFYRGQFLDIWNLSLKVPTLCSSVLILHAPLPL